MHQSERVFKECADYSKELGADYRRLYQLKEQGAGPTEIQAAKAKIKADKSRLKHVIRRLNDG